MSVSDWSSDVCSSDLVVSQSSTCPTFKSLQNKYSVLSIDETEPENSSIEAAVRPRQILQRPPAEAAERPLKKGRSVAAERPPNPKTSAPKEEKTSKKPDT